MFERGIGHRYHELIGREAICFNDDRPAFAPCRVQQRTKLVERNFLVPEINHRRGASRDADDLLVNLWTQGKSGKRQGNRDPGLQHESGTQEEEE